jgi:large subunit ribosomal protein L13
MQNKSTEKDWYIFDAKGKVLGRLATEIATLLRGKNKPGFLPNIDNGDHVVVLNAKEVALTGKKEEQKRYYKHTGYLGNLKTYTVPELREDHPEEIINHAVRGMLPKNKLSDLFMGRLNVYAGDTHPHQNVKFKNQG